MPIRASNQPVPPQPTPLTVLLGLRDSDGGEWTALRRAQYAGLGRSRAPRLLAQTGAAIATLWALAGSVPVAALAAWLAILAASLWLGLRAERTLLQAPHQRIGDEEVGRHALAAAINAMAWAAPALPFGFFVPDTTGLTIWAILATLVTASAILLPAVPIGTVLLAGAIGTAGAVQFLAHALYEMVVVSIAFCALVAAGAMVNARRFISGQLARADVGRMEDALSLAQTELGGGAADWLWHTDDARRIRSASPRFAFALGTDPAALEGQPLLAALGSAGPEQHPSLRELAERLMHRQPFAHLEVQVTLPGGVRWWDLSASPQLGQNGMFLGFQGVGTDITQARRSSETIAHMARYDSLTGLPNRTMMTETLASALARADQAGGSCAFLVVDLSRFKPINDSLGHAIGGRLLASVAQRLAEQMDRGETCGRLGADEFAIIVPDAPEPATVERVAKRIIARLSQPYEVEGHSLFVGVAIGSARGPADAPSVQMLMRNADLALYRAKELGGNVHFAYEPALHAVAEEKRQLEASLRRALERRELSLHYQPVVDGSSGAILSSEALLRWNSPQHGPISPAKFVPLAEDTRLVIPIGEWVLRQACEEAMRWPEDIRIAVNVSGEQLLDPNFVSHVVGALTCSGLPARRLEIEVTESIFVRDAALARSALETVMALGCGVSLDDFGTGYSSLGYLRALRFSTIKIDRSFVKGAATGSAESLAIIRAVVAMADSLGMSTVAEGVETPAELQVVRELGCSKIQGFYFGKPMPAADAARLFDERRTAAR